MDQVQADRIEAKQDLILSMLRTLLQHLVEDEDDTPDVRSLDGGPATRARDSSQSLG